MTSQSQGTNERNGLEIAVIGMAGRFPGAGDPEALWRVLRDGVECVSRFSAEDLAAAGVTKQQREHPDYVPARASTQGIEEFDAAFFDFSPREAEITDPQQRLFLECSWEALENAALSPDGMRCGIYAGCGLNDYFLNHVHPRGDLRGLLGRMSISLGAEKDFLCSRVAYKLNLLGPALTVQTACSTSLVAVCLACEGLLVGDCDVALAGGVSVPLPQGVGYQYYEGSIFSSDGRCRAFDARADGCVPGSGVAIVVLKRLEDALTDGDPIRAVILGWGLTNDGAGKPAYTAPRIQGQVQAIRRAHTMAEVAAETITYVEAHGTGTALGDPIEVAALTEAFGATRQRQFCALGSLKTNMGHLDAAAGAAGLIKTVLALEHRQIPPSLHYTTPNPEIDFENSPFYVNAKLDDWSPQGVRRAGTSSFGIGGTNAHVVLEEARVEASDPDSPWQLLVLSARSATALEETARRLGRRLDSNPEINLADVAHTLQVGRKAFSHRAMLVCRDTREARRRLVGPELEWTAGLASLSGLQVNFLFPGQGEQQVRMGEELYREFPAFRQEVDHCAELFAPHLGVDLRSSLYPDPAAEAHAKSQLAETWLAQPALFTVEYALARLLRVWGVLPAAMMGHSLGEYVTACLAGVFTLEEVVELVALRGRLMQGLEPGAMLAVALPAEEVGSWLGSELSLAAVNAPSLCVVAGRVASVEVLERELSRRDVWHRRLDSTRAFHSAMVDPILGPFLEAVSRLAPRPAQSPYLSNVTGTWITPQQAADPQYWVDHMRQPVLFSAGVETLLQHAPRAFLQVGPGGSLASLTRRHCPGDDSQLILRTLRDRHRQESDLAIALEALGRMWLVGGRIEWSKVSRGRRRRIPLPTYPFERRRFWLEPAGEAEEAERETSRHRIEVALWKQTPLPQRRRAESSPAQAPLWLVFGLDQGFSDRLQEKLKGFGHRVVTVIPGERFVHLDGDRFEIRPHRREDYEALQGHLPAGPQATLNVLHLWSLDTTHEDRSPPEPTNPLPSLGFLSLTFLTRVLAESESPFQSRRILVVTSGVHRVTGDEAGSPEKATVVGACREARRFSPALDCRSIDIVSPRTGSWQEERLMEGLLAELDRTGETRPVAYRGVRRFVQTFDVAPPPAVSMDSPHRVEPGGSYLVTSSTGSGGEPIARSLVKNLGATVALVVDEAEEPPDRAAAWMGDGTWLERRELEIDQRLGLKTTSEHEGLEEALHELCAAYLCRFLSQGGIDISAGRAYRTHEIESSLGILKKFHRFFQFMLRVLAENDIVAWHRHEVEFKVAAATLDEPERLKSRIVTNYPEVQDLLDLLEHCVTNYGDALCGGTEALSVLFTGRGAEILSRSSSGARRPQKDQVYLELVRELIREAANRNLKKTLKILEVGGGSGRLMHLLAPDLKELEVSYHFTDKGRSFVVSAEREARRRGLDFLSFGGLDIAKDPREQGYGAGTFDFILAFNVLHAAPRLEETLRYLKDLLAPGGALVGVEVVRPVPWIDMVWGLTEAWWHFEDKRTASPLLSLDAWETLAHQVGFAQVEAYPRSGSRRQSADHGLFVAMAPKDSGAILGDPPEEELEDSLAVVKTDLSQPQALRKALAKAQRHCGKIDGYLHFQGTLEAPPALMEGRDLFEAVEQQVEPVLALDSLRRRDNPEAFLVVGRCPDAKTGFGAPAHYAAASYLEALAEDRTVRREGRTLVFDLDPGGTTEEGVEALNRALGQLDFSRVRAVTWARGETPGKGTQTSLRQEPDVAASAESSPDGAAGEAIIQSEIEREIAQVWQGLLGVAEIGPHDSFIELGGDSLIAVQASARLKKNLEVEVPPGQVFITPTIAELAAFIEESLVQALDEEELTGILEELESSRHNGLPSKS